MIKPMKNIVVLFLISILIGCNGKKKTFPSPVVEGKNDEVLIRSDTIINYWELEFDTIKSTKNFQFENMEFRLDLKTYSLNDSLIKRDLSNGTNSYLDYSHTKITRLQLSNEHVVTTMNIKKDAFRTILDKDFYENSNLLSTELDRISHDTLHMISELNIPDTDIQWQIKYYYLILDNRIAKPYIVSKEYVGL
tara:strand:+ start:3446 stop:4024 length:579 start_codon:yes stop_codon:yes gene_type:complete